MAAPVFHILHGEDEFSITEAIVALRAEFDSGPNAGLNTSVFEAGEASVAQILGAVEAYPFLGEVRLALVRGLLTHLVRKGAGETGKKELSLLASALPGLPDWSRLVFIEPGKLADSHPLLKLAAEKGSRGAVRRFDTLSDSTPWILERAKAANAKIEPAAARALASVTQGDLRLADNELYKLIAFAQGKPITEADVMQLTPYVAEAGVFDMVDALAEGRGERAARLAHRLLNQHEDVFGLLAMITRQFRLLLLVCSYLDEGGARDEAAVAKAVGAHPYVAKKLLGQSRHFEYAQLVQIYCTLYDYDVRIKMGEMDAELALDLLIAGMAKR